MFRHLNPCNAYIKTRQVKSPKIYFRDSGLLHQLLGIRSEKDLITHPKCGASWEGYVIEELIDLVKPDEAYYWATHNGAEIDLVIVKNGHLWGIECKRKDAPRISASMRIALGDLGLKHILVVYPGELTYKMAEKITAVPFNRIMPELQSLLKIKLGKESI